MNRRKMKKEIFGYLATYLAEYEYSDLSSSIKRHIVKDKATRAHNRRYEKVRLEVIEQLYRMSGPLELKK